MYKPVEAIYKPVEAMYKPVEAMYKPVKAMFCGATSPLQREAPRSPGALAARWPAEDGSDEATSAHGLRVQGSGVPHRRVSQVREREREREREKESVCVCA